MLVKPLIYNADTLEKDVLFFSAIMGKNIEGNTRVCYLRRIFMIDIVTIIALILGPLVAVLVARKMDDRRAKNERRMSIFRTLMATRRNRLSFDHVSSLNLVEIEFQDSSGVIQKWKTYFTHLTSDHPRREDEKTLGNLSDAENRVREVHYQDRIARDREKLLTEILHEIAKDLGYEIEVFEILEGGYFPQGWGNLEVQQELIRQYAIDLYFGKTALPVLVRYEEPPTNGEQEASS